MSSFASSLRHRSSGSGSSISSTSKPSILPILKPNAAIPTLSNGQPLTIYQNQHNNIIGLSMNSPTSSSTATTDRDRPVHEEKSHDRSSRKSTSFSHSNSQSQSHSHSHSHSSSQHALNKHGELEEEVLDLKQELERRDEFVAGVQRNYETIATLYNKSLQQITALRVTLEESNKRRDELELDGNKFSAAETRASRLIKENDELIEKQKQLQERVTSQVTKLVAFQSHVADLTDVKDELTIQLARAQQLSATQQAEIEEYKAKLIAAENRQVVQQYQQQITDLNKQYAALQQDMSAQQQRVKEAQTALTKAQNQLTRVEQERDNYQNDTTRLKKQVALIRQEHSQLTEQLAESKERCGKLEGEVEGLTAHMAVLQKTNPDLDEKLKWSEKTRETMKKQFDTVWSAKTDLELQLKELKEEMTRSQEELKSQHTSRGHDVEQLTKEVEELRKLNKELSQKNHSLEHSCHSIQKQLTGEKAVVIEEQSKNEKLRKEKQQGEAQIEQLNKQIKQMHIQIQEQQQQTDCALSTASSAERTAAELSQAQTQIQQLTTKLAEQTDLMEEQQSKRQAAEQQAKRLQSSLDDAIAKFTSQQEQQRANAEKQMSEQLGSLQAQISQLTSKLMAEQHQNAELNALLDHPRMSDADVSRIKRQEQELRATIAKLIVSEEATEASFTCATCINIYKQPVTCIPCGHSYCKACMEATGYCAQCGPSSSSRISHYPNDLLDELAAKYVFRKQALAAIKEMTQQAATTSKDTAKS